MDREFNSTVSWGAILAGSVTAAAVTLLITAFAVGGGLALVSPWQGEGLSASATGWAAGVALIAMAVIASTVGGYITGRLRHGWDDVHTDERYFRDTAHGLVTWAFATVLTVTVLAGAATHLLAAASAGAIPAAGAGAAQAASSGNVGDIYVDRLLRTETQGAAPANAPAGASSPAQGTDQAATRAELLRILGPSMTRNGTVAQNDRAYAARVVAARTGLSQAEAERRVDETIAQAKEAADKARRAAMKLALWIAASMLAGALASMFGAAEGGRLRNARWYETSARTATTVHTTAGRV